MHACMMVQASAFQVSQDVVLSKYAVIQPLAHLKKD